MVGVRRTGQVFMGRARSGTAVVSQACEPQTFTYRPYQPRRGALFPPNTNSQGYKRYFVLYVFFAFGESGPTKSRSVQFVCRTEVGRKVQ